MSKVVAKYLNYEFSSL